MQRTLVPAGKDLGHLGGAHAGGPHQLVGLTDELHIAVLDAVVHHLHEVTGATGADVGHAGLAIDLGGHGFQHGRQGLPARHGTAGHDAGALASAFLATRHTDAHEDQASGLQPLLAAHGVGVQAVAAIGHDVARLEQRQQLVKHRVHRLAGLHHHQDAPRSGH